MKKTSSFSVSLSLVICWAITSAVALSFSIESIGASLELENKDDFYRPLVGHTEAFIDESLAMTVEDVVSRPSLFKAITTKYIDFGPNSGRVWLRSKIINASGSRGTWRIDVNRQYYQTLDIFVVNGDKSIDQILQSRISDSFSDRVVKDRMLGVDLVLEANEEVDIYVNFTSDTTTFIPLSIGTVAATINQHASEHTLNWIFNGALILLIAITLMMTPITGWRISSSFSLYVFAGFIYMFHADGYTFVYFWPNHMYLNDSINLRLMVLLSAFGLAFSRILFNFKKYAPIFNRYVWVYIFITSFVSIFAYQMYQSQLLKIVAYSLVPIGALSQFIAGIIAVRLGLQGSIQYFVGVLVIVVIFLYASFAHVMPGHISLDTTLDFGHIAYVVEGLAFAAAITARLVGLRDERDRALQSELDTAHEKLELSTKLQQAQEGYMRARKTADMRRNQLSTVSHDLQQPLASLRSALSRMSGSDEDAAQQMHNAFDYLEKLAREQITSGKSDDIDVLSKGGAELFSIATVLDNVKEMFFDEATEKGLKFRYRSAEAKVETDPVMLMRAVSNLVSNAVKHTDRGGVLLAARRRGEHIRIEVWDTGGGMSEQELERCLKPHEKGTGSQGSGLGLSIVNSIADELGFVFEMRSRHGHGSAAFLYLPMR